MKPFSEMRWLHQHGSKQPIHTGKKQTLCTVISHPRHRNSQRLTSSVRALSQTRQGSLMWIRRCTSFFELELAAFTTFFFFTGGVTLVSSSMSNFGAESLLLPTFSLVDTFSFVSSPLSAVDSGAGAFGAAFLNHISSVFDCLICLAGGDARGFFTLPDAAFSVRIDYKGNIAQGNMSTVQIRELIRYCI